MVVVITTHVALLVDDGHMRGALALGAADAQRRAGEGARHGCAHAAREVDQVGPAAQIGLVQQRGGRAAGQRHEVGVGHVLVAVGIGESLRLR
jgi:hypothetical protein